jgi:hypothetical protein
MKIVKGLPQPDLLREALTQLLTPPQLRVLTGRYGLDAPLRTDGLVSLKTLQTVAQGEGVTRERARQIQAEARSALRDRAARRRLAPAIADIAGRIRSLGQTADPADIANLPCLDGLNPVGAAGLLCDCGAPFRPLGSGLTLVPPAALRAIERKVLALLASRGCPCSLTTLLTALRRRISAAVVANPDSLRRILRYLPSVAATTDDRFFLPRSGAPHLIREIMERIRLPAHARTIAHEYNAMVVPVNRQPLSAIADALRRSLFFMQTRDGSYTLTSFDTRKVRRRTKSTP